MTNVSFLTVSEVAQLMNYSESWVYKNWPSFAQYGVIPKRMNPRAELKFREDQILEMMEKCGVCQ